MTDAYMYQYSLTKIWNLDQNKEHCFKYTYTLNIQPGFRLDFVDNKIK